MNRIALMIALPGLALGVVAVGCGGGDTATSSDPATTMPARAAAGAALGDTRTCPAKSPSRRFRASITNLLPSPIMLVAREYDCSDWSGESTPGRAFTGKVLMPGEELSVTLEPYRGFDHPWTLEVLGSGGAPSLGSARLQVPAGPRTDNRLEVFRSTRIEYRPSEAACNVLPMERTGAPQTPQSKWSDFSEGDLGVVSYQGRITIVSNCVQDPVS